METRARPHLCHIEGDEAEFVLVIFVWPHSLGESRQFDLFTPSDRHLKVSILGIPDPLQRYERRPRQLSGVGHDWELSGT